MDQMDKTILLQKQVRENSEDLRSYLKDLVTWEEEMKKKESQTNNNDLPEIPIPRIKVKQVDSVKKIVKEKEKPKKIKSYDYAAWDKFDVEAECEKIDAEKKDSLESENEEPLEEYKNRLKDEALYEKEQGNQFVRDKKWDEAISCYTHAIACNSEDPIFFANRALCFLKKNELHNAEADCTSALQLDSKYVKALQRRAVAREGLKQYQESLDDLKLVLELEPHNKETRKELHRLETRLGITKEKPTADNTPKIEFINENKPFITSVPTVKKPVIKQQTTVSKDLPKVLEKSVPKTQIPWPNRPNSEIILPIKKLPHQRSKKPLRRIEILESENNDIHIETKENNNDIKSKDAVKTTSEFNNLSLNYGNSESLANILAQSSHVDVEEMIKEIENNVNETIIEKESNKYNIINTTLPKIDATIEISGNKQKSNLTISSSVNNLNQQAIETKPIGDSAIKFTFPVPKSSVQFYSNWKAFKKDYEQKFTYLSKINPTELPNIFQESLESDIFSDIIHVLSVKFIEANLPAFLYLKALSNVKRFFALTMFMSTQDKLHLKKLFIYCENKNETTKDEIDELRKKYEL